MPTAQEWDHQWSSKADWDDARLVGGPFLSLAGGTMAGELTLAGPPVNALDAATKAYVDAITPVSGPFLPMSGGIMTGMLTLAGNPVGALDAATRQYVDGVGNTATQALTVANAAVPKTGATMTGPLVLSANPTSPLGAATKQYVDGFLPLYGGVLTGPVSSGSTIQGTNLYASNALLVNSFNGYEWSFTVDANGSKWQTLRSGWTDVWDGTNGTRSWNSPSAALMYLDGGGTLNVRTALNTGAIGISGNGQFGSIGVSGSATVNGSVTANYIHLTGNLQVDGSSVVTGNQTAWDYHVNGTLYATNGAAGHQMSNLSVTGNLYAGSYGVIYPNYNPANAFAFTNLSGTIYCYENGGAVGTLVPPSSSVIKEGIAPATYDCLDAVLRTPLYGFRYVGSDAIKPVGFIAEHQHEVFPESVLMNEGAPFGIDIMVMIATLYGAVQQLAERISPAMKA